MYELKHDNYLSYLDTIEFFLIIWILILFISLLILRITIKLKKDIWENMMDVFLSKIHNFDIQPFTGRFRNWFNPTENFWLHQLRSNINPERINEAIYSVIRDIIDTENLEPSQDEWQFMGPNGDNKEFLHRNDIEGVYLRQNIY